MILCFLLKLVLKFLWFFIVVVVILFGVSCFVLFVEFGMVFIVKDVDCLFYDWCEDCYNDYIFDGNWLIEDIDVNDIV